ncbi:hypothetical protein [Bacillus sp. FJAT-45037]|uniref:hypothetical protein n=1 Tax=Bacillus sp. FJAT-45037 TaxID=2011007 RepID=UPI000C23DAF7|nr:hypothetical protein [Bacillus sp. FJAT-45037]
MKICPACNGFVTFQLSCDVCYKPLIVYGRVSDYVDDYSAYEEYEQITDHRESTNDYGCQHYIGCQECNSSSVYTFQET